MSILRFLESLRTPFFDTLLSLVTRFGEEYFFLLIALLFVWCIDKRTGYVILLTGMFGQTLNQFLKITFRVERPWVAFADFKPVESAIKEATGYSFPSGHTQIATTSYFSLAMSYKKNKIIFVLLSVLILLIGFSRMYLGVHYPTDVLVSLFLGIVIVLLVHKYFNFSNSNVFMLISSILSVLLFIYVFLIAKNELDNEFMNSSVETSAKFLGATIGFALSNILDKKYINFKTEGRIWFQIFKLIPGLILTVVIKEALKPFLLMIGINNIASCVIRYFVVVLFAGAVWPYIFTKLKGKSNKFGTNR